jgi:hypothetical protein
MIGLELWCLMPPSTIFLLYREGQFIGGENQTFQKSTTVFDKNCVLRSIEYNLLKAYLIIWLTKVVSSNPADDEVYSIQHYAIKIVSDCGFLRFSPPIN